MKSLSRLVVSWNGAESLLWQFSGSSSVWLLIPNVRSILRRHHFPLRPRLSELSVNSAVYSQECGKIHQLDGPLGQMGAEF